MTDYISRQAAIEKLENDPIGKLLIDKYNVRGWLEGLPDADVVEVVRCKDCKWYGKAGCAIDIVDETDKPKDDDYCSFGERADK